MKRSKFSEEQIVYAIRQAESGIPISDLCRQLGVCEANCYTWKKKYAADVLMSRYEKGSTMRTSTHPFKD